jgi:hypothetical protein
MRLTGEDARRWLAQNPNASFIDNRTGQRTDAQQGGFMKFLQGITKPVRTFIPAAQEFGRTIGDIGRFARGEELSQAPENYFGMTREESEQFAKDPLQRGVKAGVALGAYGVPTGGGQAATALGRIGTAAGRGAIGGTMTGFGYSDEGEELASTLRGGALGGVLGGAFQGVGEASRAIQAKQQTAGQVVDTMNVDDIAALPKRTRSGLSKQAKSAGFWDPTLSESKNIQNYLTNRGFAGNTPAETLENLTQEFNRASQLKQEGLEEVGGLSRDYLKQARQNLDEAIRYKGIGLDSESTKVYNDIVKTLEKGPQGAKELDNIIMKWNEAGRLAKGAQKTSTAGLYADAARELRNAMRSTSPTYDSALQALNQILGIEDVGTVAGSAKTAAGAGLDLPLFSGAGFRGADIKTPFIGDTISKTQAAIGRAQEAGTGLGANMLQGAARVAEPVARAAQQPGVIPGLVGARESMPGRQPEVMDPQMQQMQQMQGMPQQQGPQIDQMALVEAVLSGQISTTEADWLMNMLGSQAGGVDTSKLNEHALSALDALDQLERLVEEVPLAKTGVGGFLKGPFLHAAGATGVNENVRIYEAIKEAFGATLARAGGETGNLTNEDVNRALGKLPKIGDSREMARRKMIEAREFLYTRLGVTPEDLGREPDSALYQLLQGGL